MTSPRQWDDGPELTETEQHDELIRQLHRQPGVIGVRVDDQLVRILLDPAAGGPATTDDLVSTVRQYRSGPLTIEIATYQPET